MPCLTHLQKQRNQGRAEPSWSTLLSIIILMALALINWPVREATYAQAGLLFTLGAWNAENADGSDLVYTVAFSRAEQPDGPLMVYRASGAALQSVTPVFAMQRSPLLQTPVFFPSPDGRYLALLNPVQTGYATNLNGAALSIVSTDGQPLPPVDALPSRSSLAGIGSIQGARLLAEQVAIADQVIWAADSRTLYYHSGETRVGLVQLAHVKTAPMYSGFDEIHRVDLAGHDVTLFRQSQGDGSLRLIGLDRSGALVLTLARPHMPVSLLRLDTGNNAASACIGGPCGHSGDSPTRILTLPPDILPGNVLRVGSDGVSIECERVTSWQPLRYHLVRIAFSGGAVTNIPPLFDTSRYVHILGGTMAALNALSRSVDGEILVMSQVVSTRSDLAAQGTGNVPAQERLVLANARTGALQALTLPYGGQIVQVFWTRHTMSAQLHSVPQSTLAQLLAFHKRLSAGPSHNASVFQQDEWMLEGHANLLFDGPVLPSMCYGQCSSLNGAPHISAAILHGVAYTESNWHQFNSPDYQVNGETVGTPVESWDGGWGEYQQTWGMPPQCKNNNTCRTDAFKIQHDQSYNIGVGVQSLINAWNNTAGVASQTDPNDPYKSNDWFFAVWAYNGSYGNNPNDVASSQYAHWYPGAPFRSIYEEYVWYYAAHPQFNSSGWTDNYAPSLGPALLPPQADFTNTADSFVACVTCSIPDWTPGSYDRDWVGMGAPNSQVASDFTTAFAQLGGEGVLGLPRDNRGGALMHRWGNGWVQDLGGGSGLPGALMLVDGTTTPYWMHGGVWIEYLNVDHGASGCHGYPTSNFDTLRGSGSDTYWRQTFQQGYITWDATTNSVAADLCSQ